MHSKSSSEPGKGIFSYGPTPEQYFRLRYPAQNPDDTRSLPVIILIHGGFWKARFGIDNSAIESLPPFFTAKGFIVCEIEYRRREHIGGGFPGSNEDCLEALQELNRLVSLPEADPNCLPCYLDLNRTVLIGHSAGGYTALWLSCNDLPFQPLITVALAPIGMTLLQFYHSNNLN